MAGETRTNVRLYYFPRRSRTCGCGPIGLSEELMQKYVRELETNVPGARVETVDVSQVRHRPDEPSVAELLDSYGPAACPIFTAGSQVISAGPSKMNEVVKTLRNKLATAKTYTYNVCRMVPEQRVKTCTYQVCRMVPEQRVRQVPYTVLTPVECSKTVTCVKTVARKVPYTVTRGVPRVISECVSVPVCVPALNCCQAAILPEQRSEK